MVASLCGFGHKSPKRILPSTDQDLKSDTLTESIIKCMKPRCSWSVAKKKKIQPNLVHHHQHDTKKQQQQQTLKNDSNNNGSFFKTRNHQKVATLEEWILASPPGPNDLKDSRHSLSHKKVYPSSSSSSLTSRRGLTVEGVVINGVEEAEDYYHSSTTSFTSGLQSGKMKKKVSFRLPEVADIFILDDPLPH